MRLDALEQEGGLLGREAHAAMRGRRAERADVARAVDGVASAALFGNTVHVLLRDPSAEERVVAALNAAGNTVHNTQRVAASLEDVFIDLVSSHA